MLVQQLRGPLMMRAHDVWTRHTTFVLIGLVTFVLTCWHFYGPILPSIAPAFPAFSHSRLPKYWSVTGKTGKGNSLEGITDFKRPEGLKIVALVFYGRPATVSILDCYLKRNLAENGGLLDEVIFLARTRRTKDLVWLDELIQTSPSYRQQNVTSFIDGDFRSAYNLVQNGTMYIKIDDDIVFIEDTAIPTLVSMKLEHPEYYLISANVMNQPSLSWVHDHLGVVKPYLPELEPPSDFDHSRIFQPYDYKFTNTPAWRASELPTWQGPPNFNFTDFFLAHPNGAFPGHRWLPLRGKWNNDNTPITLTHYDAFGEGWLFWYIAAQQHYSFLEHLENNELFRYKFPRWDYNYQRMGIQFVAIMGDDINKGKPITTHDDEMYWSEVMTKMTGRHGIVDGRAMVAHYSFFTQQDGLGATDVLDRYRAFATEKICYKV